MIGIQLGDKPEPKTNMFKGNGMGSISMKE